MTILSRQQARQLRQSLQFRGTCRPRRHCRATLRRRPCLLQSTPLLLLQTAGAAPMMDGVSKMKAGVWCLLVQRPALTRVVTLLVSRPRRAEISLQLLSQQPERKSSRPPLNQLLLLCLVRPCHPRLRRPLSLWGRALLSLAALTTLTWGGICHPRRRKRLSQACRLALFAYQGRWLMLGKLLIR